MRILKFKSKLTIALFAAVNHLNGPLRKQNFSLTGSKGYGLWFVIGGFWSVFLCFCVSRFVACDRNYDWQQRKTQLWRRLLNFRVRMFVKRAVKLPKNEAVFRLKALVFKTPRSAWFSLHLTWKPNNFFYWSTQSIYKYWQSQKLIIFVYVKFPS